MWAEYSPSWWSRNCTATLATVSTQRLPSSHCLAPLQKEPGHSTHKLQRPTGIEAGHHAHLFLRGFQAKLKADLFSGLYLWLLITFIRHSRAFCDTHWRHKSNRLCLQRDGRFVCQWMWGWGVPCLWLWIPEFLKLMSSHRWHLAQFFLALLSLPLLSDHAAILLLIHLPSLKLSADGYRPSKTWHRPTSLSHLLHKNFPTLFSVPEEKTQGPPL